MASNTSAKKNKESKSETSSPHHYDVARFSIPERVSSLTPVKKQRELEELEKNIKRTHSQLTMSSTNSSKEFLVTKRQCLELEEEKFAVLHEGLREAHEAENLSKAEFHRLTKECFENKAKITQEAITVRRNENAMAQEITADDEPDMVAAYANLLPLIFKNEEKSAGCEERDKHYHNKWKAAVRTHYNSHDPKHSDQLWCPIMQKYANSSARTAAHIVPHHLGFANVGYMFGEPDSGYDIIWSLKNGIMMASYLETQFDRGDFVLLPDPASSDNSPEYKFVLMNQSLRNHSVGDSEMKYKDLERRLVWKNEQRPAARYLYYHYVTTILRYQKYEKSDWAKNFLNKRTGVIWATPGPYLKKSMVRKLGQYLGDKDAEQTYEGTFDQAQESKDTDEEGEELAAKALASRDIENEDASSEPRQE